MNTLTGSEKQIAWATEIIKDAKYTLKSGIEMAEDRYALAIEQSWPEIEKERVMLEAKKAIAKISEDYLDNVTSAKDVIEYRGKAYRKVALDIVVKSGNVPQVLFDVAKLVDRKIFGDVIVNF